MIERLDPRCDVLSVCCDAWVRYCEGFRMPAHDGGAARTGAGVRKPPREETAGRDTWAARRRYGDLSAADEACDWRRAELSELADGDAAA